MVPALHLDLEGLPRLVRRLHVHDGVIVPDEVGQMRGVQDLHGDERHLALEHGVEEVEQHVGPRRIAEQRPEHAAHPRADAGRLGGNGHHHPRLTRRVPRDGVRGTDAGEEWGG